jgi:hypothetical protein
MMVCRWYSKYYRSGEGNRYDDTHGEVVRCLVFVRDSEVMLVLGIAECLRSIALLLDCLIARLLSLLRRLSNGVNLHGKEATSTDLGWAADIPSLPFPRRSRQPSVLCRLVRYVYRQPKPLLRSSF